MTRVASLGRLHWVVIISSLLLTIAAWQVSNSLFEQRVEQRFNFLTNQLLTQITERMNRYEDALRTGVVAIHTQDKTINSEGWKRFSDALELAPMYPGINGIGVIYDVKPDELNDFVMAQKKTRPDFKIHPVLNHNDVWPITYIEPLKGNEQAIGLDISFEENRFSAAKKARDSAQTHITKPIVLVQDEKKTPGFLQFVPFYNSKNIATEEQRKEHFIGHVFAPFIMQKFISGTLSQKDIKQDNRHLIFSIYDNNELLYDELNTSNPNYQSNSLYSKKIDLKVYNRLWTFTIQTAPSFIEAVGSNKSTYVLVSAIFIDGLLIFIFVILSLRNKNSLILVDEMTKKILLEEEYFRHVIESAPCGMIISNNKGIIEEANPQAEVLFGYTRKELVGQSIDMLVPHRLHDVHSKYRQGFYKNKENRRMGNDRNVYGLRSDGKEFPAEIGLTHFEREDGTRILATIIDMTEYVNITNDLKRSNKDLNEFAYVASHDLKAPLRGIMQLASWIEEDITDIASEETKGHLGLLQSRTARLEKLLDDLLTYSRVGNHLGDIEEVDTQKMVQLLFQLLDPPAEFSLQISDDLPVFKTLAVPLEIIFRNLIGNAIKHHDKPNGVITVAMVEYEDIYEFSVTNDGPAIAERHHQKIFEMFKTLRPRDEVEGSGMGLSIIKKMLDCHGQKIRIISEGDRGVTFSFTWPKNFTRKG